MTTGNEALPNNGRLPRPVTGGQNAVDATRPLGTVGMTTSGQPAAPAPATAAPAPAPAAAPAPITATPPAGIVGTALNRPVPTGPTGAPTVARDTRTLPPTPAPVWTAPGELLRPGTQYPTKTDASAQPAPPPMLNQATQGVSAAQGGIIAPEPLKVGSDAVAPGLYPAGTMNFNPRNPGEASLRTATPTTGPLAGLSDDQLFTLIAYGTDQNTKTAAKNAVFTSLGGNTTNYNNWINSFNGPKQTELSSTANVAATMQAIGGGAAGAGGGIVNSALGGPTGVMTGAGGVSGGEGATNTGASGASGGEGATSQYPGNNVVNGQDLSQFAPEMKDYSPVMGEVQANQTVQGQLGDILRAGNPLLEAAKARAMQTANARGLQNSSMAAQAGEEAIVNTALPIAQADAAAYQKQALVNQDITNQFLSMKEGAQLDLQKAYEAFKQNNFMFDKDDKLKRYLNDSQISSNEKVAAMQAAAQVSAAQIHANAALQSATLQANTELKALGMKIDADKVLQQAQLDASQKVNLANLSQNAFNNYVSGMNSILGTQMEPADKDKWIKDYNTFWAGNGYLKDSGITIKLPGG